MKVRSVLLARAALLTDIRTSIYYPDLVSMLVKRYEFVQFPSTPQDILPQDGVLTFGHGRILPPAEHKRPPIVIDVLTVQRQAIMVQVSTDTNDSDYVLTDIAEWCISDLDARLEPGLNAGRPRIYVSQLEVQFENSPDRLLPPISKALSKLNEKLATQARENFEPTTPPPISTQSLVLNIDPLRWSLPCDFRVERRIGTPYEQNVFFSQAPLQTIDHSLVLQELEEGLAG